MADIIIHPSDAVYDRIICEDAIAEELYHYFSFKEPNADFMIRKVPRLRRWDGYIHLFQRKRHKLYAGLRSRVEKFAEDRNFTVEYSLDQFDKDFSEHEARDFIKSLKLPAHIEPRDYQVHAFVKAVRKYRLLTVSPTASGKSFIIYLLTRHLNLPTLIITPTINLVDQMIGHFNEYGYNTEKNVQQIYAGLDKTITKLITISTWQSIYDLPKEYFTAFGCVVVDECHHAQASSIRGIMENATAVNYRYGFTGTLDEIPTHRLVLEGLFGEVHQVVTTRELIEQGHVADLEIKVLILKYPDAVCQVISKMREYNDQMEFIVTNELRRRYLNNLVLSLKGNAIVLFRYVDKHGKVIFSDLKKASPNPVHYISGETDVDTREQIRAALAGQEDADLVGSYGCVSTGFDSPSLKHVIFGSPYKSKIKVLQSIGRGLRKYNGQKLIVYDIVDDLSHGTKRNFALDHAVERIKIYSKEFPGKYKIYKIQLK